MFEQHDEPRMSKKVRLLVLLALMVGGLVSLLVIESCDTEKVQICDLVTGDCEYESTCRPLLVDLYYGLLN